MKQILPSKSRQVAFELKLGYLLPVFLGLALLINTQIANASALRLRNFAPVVIHPRQYANYSRDAINLRFAPIDPSIIDAALSNLPKGDGQAPEVPLAATPTPQPVNNPTSTPIVDVPTLPNPTLPPLLSTLPPLLPTLLPVVPTLIPVIPTVAASIIDLLPTVLPCIPPIQTCN